MAEIIRGTTPTIKYKFETVEPSDIVVAYLTAKQNDDVLIDKGLSEATVGDDYLAWTLTQEETLNLSRGKAYLMCNWKNTYGTRGASRVLAVNIVDNQKDEVI